MHISHTIRIILLLLLHSSALFRSYFLSFFLRFSEFRKTVCMYIFLLFTELLLLLLFCSLGALYAQITEIGFRNSTCALCDQSFVSVLKKCVYWATINNLACNCCVCMRYAKYVIHIRPPSDCGVKRKVNTHINVTYKKNL